MDLLIRSLLNADSVLAYTTENFAMLLMCFAIFPSFSGTLQQLCTIVTPSEFLSLLPDDGCIGFFLPYLQQCYSRCASDLVNKRLVTRTRQLTS